ncbi:MAG: FtsX-like permease family protein [Thermonemataceae bacterium]|nr:FtsX-like permease family protein [Thermonemataceae bacterium]
MLYYWKTALRSLAKRPWYVFINVVGLAIAFSVSLFILLYVEREINYDKQWEKSIYRLATKYHTPKETRKMAATEPHIIATFSQAFTKNIHQYTKILPTEGTILSTQQKSAFYNDIFFTDEKFFEIFAYKPLKGSISNVFEPNSKEIILTESLAKELFGTQNPVGKTLELRTTNAFSYDGAYLVKAVISNPKQTHFRFKALISWNSKDKFVENSWAYFYFRWRGSATKDIKEKWKNYYQNYLKRYFPQQKMLFEPIIQPIESIYLNSKLEVELSPNTNKNYLFIFMGIALLMLVVACINFINTNSVQLVKRLKELGVRRVLGENTWGFFLQNLAETSWLLLFFLIFSLSISELLLPVFNILLQTELYFSRIYQSFFLMAWISFFLLLILLAGLYPTFAVLRIHILELLRNQFHQRDYRFYFRKTLLVFQFVITLVIMSVTLMVLRQLVFLKNTDLGFEQQHILILRLPKTQAIVENLEVFKEKILQNPDIYKVANSAEIMGTNLVSQFRFETEDGKEFVMGRMAVSNDFTEVMGLDVVQGEKFSEVPTDEYEQMLINEAAISYLPWKNPIGKKLIISRDSEGNPLVVAKILGVVKNFHSTSLHSKISPLAMIQSSRIGNLYLNIAPKQRKEVMLYLQNTWQEIFDKEPFNAFFLYETYDKHYIKEEILAKLLAYFSMIMALVASLGLLALALFMSELRMKEIAIRKVLGASKISLIWLLSKDFIFLIILALFLAIPISYELINIWLKNFAYTTTIKPGIFVIAFALTLLIALIPLLLQVLLRVFTSPIKVLQNP